jgi:hypothetical protein
MFKCGSSIAVSFKFQELEVRPGHDHVVGLAALPTAQIEPIRAAISEFFVGVQADIRVAFLSVPAGAACHIEWNRADVALFEVLNVRADFDDLTGVLVAHNHPGGSGEAAIVDMQIAAADIRRDEFQHDRVLDFSAL